MLRLTLAAGTLALAAADTYNWNGRSSSIDDPELWDGAYPGDASATVAAVTMGTAGMHTVVGVPALPGNEDRGWNFGRRLQFDGDVKLMLGSGTGRVKLNFDATAALSPNAVAASFAPLSFSQSDARAAGFDYNCNLNWLVNGRIPADPPCNDDDVLIGVGASNGVQLISTFNNPSAASSVTVQSLGGTERVTQCDTTALNYLPFTTAGVTFNVDSCPFMFKFGNRPASRFTSCPTTTCAGVQISTDADGNTVQIYTSGPNAGTVYITNPDGTVTRDTMDATNTSTGTVYTYSNFTIDQSGTVGAKPSTGGGDDSSSSTIIIAIVVVALIVIIAIVVVVVVMVKKSAAGASTRDAGIVSFENPMYDDLDNAQKQPHQDTYDEPEMASSGYMDVPAGAGGDDDEAGGFGGSGYMDVAPGEGGASGYMDVAPEGDDDDDSDGDI